MFVHFRCYKEFTYFASPGQERLKVDEGALAEVLREEGVEEVLEEASSEALESCRWRKNIGFELRTENVFHDKKFKMIECI